MAPSHGCRGIMRTIRMLIRSAYASLLLTATVAVPGQTFRSGSELVTVPVSVSLLSDEGENASRITLDRIVATRRQSETQIHAFNLDYAWDQTAQAQPGAIERTTPTAPGLPMAAAPPLSSHVNADTVADLVNDSGGTSHLVRTREDAQHASGVLLDELRFLYLLGYTPKKALDGRYHKLKVEVRQPGLLARYRRGYVAKPAP